MKNRNYVHLKAAGYKIKTHKSIAFLYINNERTEREIKEITPFTTETERIKYLGINLLKETKESYKILMKEIKDDTKDGEIYHVIGLEESIL